MNVIHDFQEFVDSISDINYHEICDLYYAAQTAIGNESGQSTFEIKPAKGSDEDMLIIYEPNNCAIRLTKKAAEYFPVWIEENLMEGMDVESFWGFKHASEKDD